MNSITVVGRLTSDPVIKEVNGSSVCNFTIADNVRRKDADGNPLTNFFRVDVWRAIGENCAKYLKKGDRAVVFGPLVVRTYTDTNGQLRYSLDITANDVEFAQDRRNDSGDNKNTSMGSPNTSTSTATVSTPENAENDGEDDDLPF